jgi:hypothetical protein
MIEELGFPVIHNMTIVTGGFPILFKLAGMHIFMAGLTLLTR